MYTHSFLESANVGNCRNVNKRIELMFVRETDLQNVTELSDVWKSDQKKIFGIFQVWSTYWIGGAAWSPDYLLLCGGNELSVGRRQGSGGFGVIFNNKIVPDWTENSKKKRKTSHECETALTSQSLTLFLVFAFCLFGCISRKKEKNSVLLSVFMYFPILQSKKTWCVISGVVCWPRKILANWPVTIWGVRRRGTLNNRTRQRTTVRNSDWIEV